MRSPQALLVSGILAAAVIGAMIWYVSNNQPTPVRPEPIAQQPAPQPAPVPSPAPAPAVKSYVNAKEGFSVEYPEAVIPTEDKIDMGMSGYIPVCDPDTAVVCFPRGADLVPGTNFGGAAFSVHALTTLKTEAKCLAVGNGETVDGTATIGGTSFKKFAFGDAAMGHQLSGEHYRTFRSGKCFELTTAIFTSTYENYPPGTLERFTDEDRAKVQHLLDAMLTSFRFTSGS